MSDRDFNIYHCLGSCNTNPEELEQACTALGKHVKDRMWVVPFSKIGNVFAWVKQSREVERLRVLKEKQEAILKATEQRLQATQENLKLARAKLGELS